MAEVTNFLAFPNSAANMTDLLKSILFLPKIIGAAPYGFNKQNGKIKIKCLFYSWIMVFFACGQRFYIIWCRFFNDKFFISNQTTTVANLFDSFLFDIYNESICFIFCINSVYQIKDVLVRINNFSKTELKFDAKDNKFVLFWSHGITSFLLFLFILIHVTYYFYNPFGEKSQAKHLLFSLFFIFSNPISFSLSVQFVSFTLITLVIIRKINILMKIKLQDILTEDLRYFFLFPFINNLKKF